MTKRKPLDLLQKWHSNQHWICQSPPLTRSALVVLARLLDRQNPKTGRCDPSAVGILEETGLSERSVRSAFKELEERGALKRYRINRRSRNQFIIFSVAELAQNQKSSRSKMKAEKQKDLQPIAALPAIHCRLNLQPAAPETIKETIKKKERAERKSGGRLRSCNNAIGPKPTNFGLGDFEQRLVKIFIREGYGYEGLMEIPASEMEAVYNQMCCGNISFSQAVGAILESYRTGAEKRLLETG